MRCRNGNFLVLLLVFILSVLYFYSKVRDQGRIVSVKKYQYNDEEDKKAGFISSEPDLNQFGTLYEHRLKTLNSACKQRLYHQKPKLKHTKKKYLLYSQRNNFLFCFVQKIGCTFWKRAFTVLEQMNIETLPDLSLIHKLNLPRLPQNLNDSEVIQFSERAFTVMFVRDPYERLFSGYVDKFVYPNSHYWTTYGTRIIRKFRPNVTEQSIRCGHDVTFHEFVNYVLDADEYKHKFLDDHFSPIHYHCRPCEIKYKFIGKMETFETDVNHVLHELKVGNISTKRNTTGELLQIAQDLERYRTKNETCLNKKGISDRVEKSLRYRGLLSDKQDVSYDFQHLSPANVSKYIHLITNRSSKDQRRAEMVNQYKSLGKKLLKRVAEYLKPDCKLFGYEDRPKDIFSL